MKRCVLLLDRSRGKTVTLPRRVVSHNEFVDSICKIRSAMNPSKTEDIGMFVSAMYYFLGWMVGDGIKNLGSRRLLTMCFRLQLTRKHPDNLPLGTYVMDCLKMLGVKCVRGRDGQPRKKVPNGFYSWHSSYSSAVWWLFSACLGLSLDQKTTKHPVKMGWLLDAPREMRVWFLRGLADSDGDVHFQHRWVDIATSPNTNFIKRLLGSLGFHTNVRVHRGYGYVSISCRDAASIQIFNPFLMTYRRTALERLVSAKVFRGKWPNWLSAKVDSLIRAGLDDRRISESILSEHGVYLRMRTIKKRRSALS